MSLIDEFTEECTVIDRVSVSDGVGGFSTEWRDGAVFNAAITFDNSMESRIGEKQGVSSRYTVTISKNVTLNYHDVFRRNGDKKMFRITSDSDDKYTPNISSLDMRQVSAEEFVLP